MRRPRSKWMSKEEMCTEKGTKKKDVLKREPKRAPSNRNAWCRRAAPRTYFGESFGSRCQKLAIARVGAGNGAGGGRWWWWCWCWRLLRAVWILTPLDDTRLWRVRWVPNPRLDHATAAAAATAFLLVVAVARQDAAAPRSSIGAAASAEGDPRTVDQLPPRLDRCGPIRVLARRHRTLEVDAPVEMGRVRVRHHTVVADHGAEDCGVAASDMAVSPVQRVVMLPTVLRDVHRGQAQATVQHRPRFGAQRHVPRAVQVAQGAWWSRRSWWWRRWRRWWRWWWQRWGERWLVAAREPALRAAWRRGFGVPR